MPRTLNRLHKIMTIVAFLILALGFAWFAFAFNGLPQTIGVHFSPSGTFDMYNKKAFGLYPYIAGTVILLILQLFDFLVRKSKTSKNINEQDGERTKSLIRLLLDINKLIISSFFTYWGSRIICQQGLNTIVPVVMLILLTVSAIACVIYIVLSNFRRTSNGTRT